MKIFTKVPCLGAKFADAWSELFWNTPLRALIEVFIEIAFGFFLHSQNISFLTISCIVATTVMFIAGSFVFLYPFILLNITSLPPLYVKSQRYNKKYGVLEQDLYKKKTLYERAYYPLFIINRIILTCTIVLLYQYPLLQLLIIMFCQILMIYYLIWHRPFRSELQEVIVVTDELAIIAELILLYLLYKNQHEIEKSARIGMLGYFLISKI